MTVTEENPLLEGLAVRRTPDPCAFVIFGASGDLTKRKLLPALYALAYRRLLPEQFVVVGVARTEMTDEEFRANMEDAVREFARDPFQQDTIERARTALESVLPAGALVLTTPALGRPAENITHYTHAEAHYLGELTQLLSNADLVGFRYTATGQRLFLLLPAGEPMPFTAPRDWWSATEVARRDGDALREWFVDPSRAPGGAILYEARVSITPRPH